MNHGVTETRRATLKLFHHEGTKPRSKEERAILLLFLRVFVTSWFLRTSTAHSALRMTSMGDVAIIGAGPAGSAAALLLARAGWTVRVFEQHRFPRDKVCGECVSPLGIDVLRRLGLADEIAKLGAVALSDVAVHPAGGRSVQLSLPRPMWGISRRALDAHLLEAARQAGVIIRQPVRCEAIEAGLPTALRVRDSSRNVLEICWTDHALLADGKGSLTLTRPSPTGDFGIKAHFERIDGPRDTIELFGCDGVYGGLAAIEGGQWNAAFSVPAQRLRRHKGRIDALFDRIVEENPVLHRRMEDARRTTAWMASPLPRYAVRNHWPAGVIPIGNAAAALEPITGEGIGLALRSAELAAAMLSSSAASNGPRAAHLAADYGRIWRSRRVAARAAALVVSRPHAFETLLPLVDRLPLVRDLVLQAAAK